MATRFTASTQTYSAANGVPTGTTWAMMCWAWLAVDRNDYSCVMGYESAASSASQWMDFITEVDGSTIHFDTPSGNIPMGTMTAGGSWKRLAVSVNGTAGTVYYGGETGSLTSGTGTVGSITTVSPTTFFIGNDSYGEWWNGRVAVARVWNAVLTQSEFDAEFASWDAVRTANLLRSHKLQTPSTADDSGLGRTLTGGTGASTESDPPIAGSTPQIPWPALLPPQPYTARRRAANY